MIARDPVKLHAIIHAGNKMRDRHLETLRDQVARYHGPWYVGAGPVTADEYDASNVAYQFISLMLPVLAWDNPRFEVRSKLAGPMDLAVQGLKHALDRWAVDTDLQETLELLAVDFLFSYGVLLTEMQPDPSDDPTSKDPKQMPLMTRLDPRRYGMDPFADNPRDARIQWHTWVRDKDDLLQEAKDFPDRGWNVEAIEQLAEDSGVEMLHRDAEARNAPPRHEIVGYQVFVPEWELEEVQKLPKAKRGLFKGTICDIAVSGQSGDGNSETATFIRDPRPFYGPATGPYAVVGAYKIPGKLYPLGPLTATEGQNRELNEHKRAYLKSARSRKKIGIASDKDPLLAEIVTDTPEGEVAVASVENLDRNFKEIELGGPTAEQRLTILGLQNDSDAALGMSDAKRGDVTGVGTATENSIAAASGNQRVSWKKKRFRKGVTDGVKVAAWYMWNTKQYRVSLGQEASEELGFPGGVDFQGGQGANDDPSGGLSSKTKFEDLEVNIDIMSTERLDEGEAQQRELQLFTMFGQSLPMVMQFPMADWTEAFDSVGEAMNKPDLAEKYGIPQVQKFAMAMGQAQAQAADQAQAAQQGPPPGASMQMPQPAQQAQAGPPRQVKKGLVAPTSMPQKAQNATARKAGVGA